MDNIIVRKARYTEIPALAKIQCAAWKAAFGDIITAETMEKYTDAEKCAQMLRRVFNKEVGHLYIAGIDNRACGELFWKPVDRHTAEIVALHTLKRAWGKGVGKALMDKAISDIFNDGFWAVKLWVFKDNIRARKFYEKCGFTLTRHERFSFYDKAVEVQYRRIL